ncbi:MarR family winged helix-turn-helix transcriptional regulator [Erythrobacter sp. NE805]|uniref:MarR family winged helix-turn-helix transcriptional regulator n=1 Tax=Erythrobacter sp. NE805 TaxID=3389875 RepID=UPI00396B3CAD
MLSPLADELMAVASRLRCAASSIPAKCVPCEARIPSPSGGSLAIARMVYALRRKRAALFGNPDLFGEPAWDILLDLFIAQAEGKCVSVSSACIGSAAPPTTGLRWLGVLADEGLVVRESDPEDNRRVHVRLTTKGHSAMQRFLDTVEAGS